MINSVINEASRGLQTSQRELVKVANDIARANVPTEAVGPDGQRDEATVLSPVEQSGQSEGSGDLSQSLVELRRQEQLFNASAEVVSTADRTIGSLLNTRA